MLIVIATKTSEAITIPFPRKQTIMKQDMNKFNLTQSECRIQNLINLLVNRKKLNVFSPASVTLNITNPSCHHFSVIFLMMCTFAYEQLF